MENNTKSKPVFGDLQEAERSFIREWFELNGHRLSESDQRLAKKVYMLGWINSERRFAKEPR